MLCDAVMGGDHRLDLEQYIGHVRTLFARVFLHSCHVSDLRVRVKAFFVGSIRWTAQVKAPENGQGAGFIRV